MIPDLNRLRVFACAYQHRSLVRAADELHVTRSAASQALKALEGELRTPLFVRSSKRFVPTPAAVRLHELVEPFLAALSAEVAGLERARREPAGHLRVGAPLEFGGGTLTRLIAGFRERHPLATFELELAIPVRQLERLAAGQLDLAFVDNADVFAAHYPVEFAEVWREEFVLAGPRGLVPAGVARPGRLTGLPFLDYVRHGPVLGMWFRHHFGRAPAGLAVVYSAESVHAMLTAIRAGMGLGVVPRHLLGADELRRELRVVRTAKAAPLVNRIALATARGRPLRFVEEAFRDHCMRELAKATT